MAVSFPVLGSNRRQSEDFDGDTQDTLEPLPSTHLQRDLEACPGLLLTSGSCGMPSLVCSESKLLRAELGVLCHVPRLYMELWKSPAPRQAVPTPSLGRQNRSPPRALGPLARPAPHLETGQTLLRGWKFGMPETPKPCDREHPRQPQGARALQGH